MTEGRTVVMRTSDSISFKGCRRRWDFSSHLRGNLGPIQHANPLWLGSAMHYALEDFHGSNLYGKPAISMMAFAYAFGDVYDHKVPDDWKELLQLGTAMMDYYEVWLQTRPMLDTYIFEGVPQIEANIKIPVPMEALPAYKRIIEYTDIREVFYSMQLDRVTQDDNGMLWIMEYKSAANMQTHHFATDPQCSRYVWGADNVYPERVAGVIYQQHRKSLPNKGRILLNGTVSVAEKQATTRGLYKETLLEVYKDLAKAPKANIDYLNNLAKQESDEHDAFIRRDKLYRNVKTSQASAQNILKEISDMLDPELLIYPNPTRDCPNFCPFLTPCVQMDDGSDYKGTLELLFEPRPSGYDGWRPSLPDPATFKGIKI